MAAVSVYQLGYGSPEPMLQFDLVLISCQSSSAMVLIEKLLVSFLDVNWHGFGDIMLFSFLKFAFFNSQNTEFPIYYLNYVSANLTWLKSIYWPACFFLMTNCRSCNFHVQDFLRWLGYISHKYEILPLLCKLEFLLSKKYRY